MLDHLFKKLSPDTLILTANSRLTRYLHSRFDAHQQAQQLTTWETPRILPLQSWLELQFHQTNHANQLLLTAFQEECVWQNTISESKLAAEWLQPTQMMKLVKQACDLLTQWQIPLDELQSHAQQNEVHCLIEWITAFQKKCVQQNWITQSQLPQHLQSQKKLCQLPKKIILIGFDDLNPNSQSLLTHLEKHVLISTETLTTENPEQKQIILNDADAEMETMARWIKLQWEKNPAGQFGCVIPDLEKTRSKVQRIFNQFFPSDQVNLSAGVSLAQHNMIYTALTVLKWCHTDLPIDEIATLLQSPYLCLDENEKNAGAQIDALLREQNRMQINIMDLYPYTPTLSRWRALVQHHEEKKSATLSPSQWTQHFIRAWQLMKWPGNHTQNSAEFQVLERFKKVLASFSQLDFLFEKINYQRALYLLNSLTQQTLFQPKSHHEPIQIMGALEASGILFDALWVMGLHDGVWPPATKPHPLIPYAIQQQHHMPHATAKRELQFCENMTKRLENAAKQVIFSSPAAKGDQQYFPSRLIQHIPMIPHSTLLFSTELLLSEKLFQTKQMETFEDNMATALTDFGHIHGGSKILKLQALCPFQAFGTIRLQANALHNPAIGITPATKGTLIHAILFQLWGEIKDQPSLNDLTDESLDQFINNAIDIVFSENKDIMRQTHNHYFFGIEKKRLRRLIREWLLLEKSRPYFRVLERETESHLLIGKLPIKIRADRIDQLNDGSLFLIDYKTGLNSIAGWFQERLTDTQLPLYAAFLQRSDIPFLGVAYAEIRTSEMKFKGVIHETHLYAENTVSGLTPVNRLKTTETIFSWNTLIETWKQSLEKLADDFCGGVAIVDPVEKKTCERCDLKPICRYE